MLSYWDPTNRMLIELMSRETAAKLDKRDAREPIRLDELNQMMHEVMFENQAAIMSILNFGHYLAQDRNQTPPETGPAIELEIVKFLRKLTARRNELIGGLERTEQQLESIGNRVLGEHAKQLIELALRTGMCYKGMEITEDGRVTLGLCHVNLKSHEEMLEMLTMACAWKDEEVSSKAELLIDPDSLVKCLDAILYLKDEWNEISRRYYGKHDDGSFVASVTLFREKLAAALKTGETLENRDEMKNESIAENQSIIDGAERSDQSIITAKWFTVLIAAISILVSWFLFYLNLSSTR